MTKGMLLTSSTAMVPFLSREALCSTSRVNAPARRIAFMVSYRAPGSSAGLPEYLTMSPASVLTDMTRCSASLCTVDWLVPELIEAEVQVGRTATTAKSVDLFHAASTGAEALGQLCPLPGLGRLRTKQDAYAD